MSFSLKGKGQNCVALKNPRCGIQNNIKSKEYLIQPPLRIVTVEFADPQKVGASMLAHFFTNLSSLSTLLFTILQIRGSVICSYEPVIWWPGRWAGARRDTPCRWRSRFDPRPRSTSWTRTWGPSRGFWGRSRPRVAARRRHCTCWKSNRRVNQRKLCGHHSTNNFCNCGNF